MQEENNPFSVLGLEKNATLDSVKSAYRRLAMRWHPDRNPDPSAAQHFQMVQAAYELLSAELNRNAGNKKRDIHQRLHLNLEEAFFGAQKRVSIWRKTQCSTCQGSGKAGLVRNVFCKKCLGSGKILRDHHLAECADCLGKGLIVEQICPDCAGKGVLEKEIVLSVNVPAGVLSGDELRLTGQGESPENEGEIPGDLYLNVVLSPDPFFQLENRDLHCVVKVALFDFLTGHTLTLPFWRKDFQIEIPPFTQEFVLEKKGFPGGKNGEAGDLFLHFSPVYPQHLSDKNLNILKKMAKTQELPKEVQEWQEDLKKHCTFPR